jgi:hypothetical protein
MLLVPHPQGHVAVTQAAHAWISGQLARAWGGERFGAPEPREEVCLAAEQHDVGMVAWDRDPELHPHTGLPTSFLEMDLATHLGLWTAGPESLLGQSRYAALLASLHGSALYARRELAAMDASARDRVVAFLKQRRDFEAEIRASLAASDAEVARNQRLLWTWDGLSLALILRWAPWTAESVPDVDGESDVRLRACDDSGHSLAPWPFAAAQVTLRTQGRFLGGPFAHRDELRRALGAAPWVDLTYELLPG